MSQDPAEPLQPPKEKHESKNSFVLIIGAVMLVGLMLLAWIGSPPRSKAIGEKLPRIDLQPLANASQALTKEGLLGKYSVIHFWGTWCPHCLEEFPEFVELVEAFQDNEDVAVLSVSCSRGPEYDLQELRENTQSYLSKYALPIPTYSDSTALTRQQLALLLPNGSLGYPTTIVVDPKGTIIEAIEGYVPGEMEQLATTLRKQLSN